MAILPEDVPTGLLTGQYYFVNEDTLEDADANPQLLVVTGKVKIRASVKTLRWSAKKAVVIPLVFDAKFDNNGNLVPDNGNGIGVRLPATDSFEFDTRGWTWTATFELVAVETGYTVNLDPITFTMPVGGEIDLSEVIPSAPSAGVVTLRGPQGVQGQNGSNVLPTNAAILQGLQTDPAIQEAINSEIDSDVQIKRYPEPMNLAAIAPFRSKLLLARRNPVIVTCIGDSINWGVGVDGVANQTTSALSAQNDIYRENSWAYQMASNLNAPYGLNPVNGWVGPGYSDVPSSWAAATASANSIYTHTNGPFGGQTGVNRGGARLAFNGYTEWDTNTLSRPFTELDVFAFNGPEFSDAAFPSVYVDGVKVYSGAATSGGTANRLGKFTLTGLSNTTHTIRLTNDVSGKNVYGAFVVPRHKNGVVVNRISSPGATSTDAVGRAGGLSRPRAVPSTVLPGYSDLAVIALSTNDNGQQVPLATFKANIKELIDAADCPVLLLDGPPTNSDLLPIKLAEYTAVLRQLSTDNPDKVAFAPISALFGKRSGAVARSLFATANSVHPSFTGANLIADYVTWVLQRSYQPV